MNDLERWALTYVANTNGGATLARFNEDHEPIGPRLWKSLSDSGLVTLDDIGCVWLTHAGRAAVLPEDVLPSMFQTRRDI
jgi:hypothetical protein